jgi:hypothetical protein
VEFFLVKEVAINQIRWPDVTFSNEAHERDTENEELEIFPDVTLEYTERGLALS